MIKEQFLEKYAKEQFLEKYAKENTAVHCETRELAEEFLTLCEKFNIKWFVDLWNDYKEHTCFSLNGGRFLTYGSKSWYEHRNFTIIPFEIEQKKENKMNKEERVKLVFETISKIAGFEIKPDKNFYMNANGNKGVYKISESLQLLFKDAFGDYKTSMFGILPIFKGGYDLKEIKEPLLTKEGKEFLGNFNFDVLSKKSNILYLFSKNATLIATIALNNINLSIGRLKEHINYSREELGL